MQAQERRIVVLATGGTIAGRAATASDNLGYRAAQLGVEQLLAGVPVPAGWAVEGEQVAQVDSKDMDFGVWRALAQRCDQALARDDVAGIVVTHGTDTMEETAFFLQAVLAPRKPVVLTGAMRPATSVAADGPQNLADALSVAASGQARGVCVVFAGAVHGAPDVRKVHGYRADAFSSGDAGPVAYVEEGALRVLRPWPEGTAVRDVQALPQPAQWPRVEIILSHAGASGAIVAALVKDGVRGLVVAGTGNGTVHAALEGALLQAQDQGVVVRRASRCLQGRVLAHAGDRLPVAQGLTPVQARIALMLELMAG
ncbi:asparaginase [Ramlibacter alkalitolerans]|uniref:Asparaginase n=1 Tax=Ramlibacter alkalitolerans TaxID=2039631 RepID=A0ABS1JLJ4_9BURK|nr:asparaginase [Ramlibacter alkalitolerans]MBL0424786.1 asparaginase [Ramlibacter alkalitolerans]